MCHDDGASPWTQNAFDGRCSDIAGVWIHVRENRDGTLIEDRR